MSVAVVTGADGFIGRHLVSGLTAAGWEVRPLVRARFGDLATADETALATFMAGAGVVYHLAGRAHRRGGGRNGSDEVAYVGDNVVAVQRVHAAAGAAGVKRLVYLSSIKVLGEVSAAPLSPDAPAAPTDVYAASKLQAERWLTAHAGDPAVTIVRPPLVVGAGVKGNVATLIRWTRHRFPLPLGLARAPRSVVGVANLVDLLTRIANDDARSRVLHVRDDDEPTAADMVKLIARALDERARLWNVSPPLLRLAAGISRRQHLYRALFEPYRVDDSATREVFDWRPRRAIAEEFANAARACR